MNYLQRRRYTLLTSRHFKGYLKTTSNNSYQLKVLNATNEYPVNISINGSSVQDSAPTPDTPVEILSCGEPTANLFDVSDRNTDIPYNDYTYDNEGWITLSYNNTNGTAIQYPTACTNVSSAIKPNTNYRLVCEVKEITGCTIVPCTINSYYPGQFNTFISIKEKGITVHDIVSLEDMSSCTTMLRSHIGVPIGSNAKAVFRLSVFEDPIPTVDTFVYKPYENWLSENIYNVSNTTGTVSGVLGDDDWVTIAYDNTEGTSTKYRFYNTGLNKKVLKPNTTYTIVIEIKEITLQSGYFYPISYYTSTDCSQFAISARINTVGTHIIKRETLSDFSGSTSMLRTYLDIPAGASNSVTFRISILEYDGVTVNNFQYEPYGKYKIPLIQSGYNLYNVNRKYTAYSKSTVSDDDWTTITYDNTANTSIRYPNFMTSAEKYIQPSQNYLLITEVKEISGCTLYSMSSSTGYGNDGQFSGNTVSVSSTGTYISIITARDDMSSSLTITRTQLGVNAGAVGTCTFRISIIDEPSIKVENFTYEPYVEGGNNLYNVYDTLGSWYSAQTADDDGWVTQTADNTEGASDSYRLLYTAPSDVIKPYTIYRLVVEIAEMENCYLNACSGSTSLKGQFQSLASIKEPGTTIKLIRSRTEDDIADAMNMIRTEMVTTAGCVGKIKYRISVLEYDGVTPEAFEYCKFNEPTTYNIYVDEPIKGIGDVSDIISLDVDNKTCIDTRNWTEYIINKDSDLEIDTVTDGEGSYFSIAHGLGTVGSRRLTGYCNYFVHDNSNYSWGNFWYPDNRVLIGNLNSDDTQKFTSVDEFKEWLGDKTLVFLISLLESTETDISHLQNWDNIKKLYRETNVIEANTSIKPSAINTTYYIDKYDLGE